MESRVDLKFRVTRADYLAAARTAFSERVRWKLDTVMLIVLLAFAYYLSRAGQHALAWACAAVASLSALIAFLGIVVVPHIYYSTEKRYRDEQEVSFTAEGIHYRTTGIDARLEWRIYSRAIATARGYYLFASGRFSVLPMRAFESEKTRMDFERLLQAARIPLVRR